jgi:poly-gamma-glutamate synthesis protein (capsule biosynthesis protein)
LTVRSLGPVSALLLVHTLSLPAQAPPERDSLRLVFVGDMNFARSVARTYIFPGRGAELLAGVRDRLRAADVAVGNLESLILDRGRHADTTNSPVFAGPVEALDLLRDAGFDVLGTANNHAWDFGRAGLLESLGHLDRAGFLRTGTGATVGEALRPAVVRARGWTVAIFAVTAIFNYEDLTVIGHAAECCVAWADTLRLAERFRAARDSLGADVVVAFVHQGSVEYRSVPHPGVVQLFRALARAGADAVIGHHPHVPQGLEYQDGRPLLYSLGNFVFKQRQRYTNWGLWAELTLRPGGAHRLEVLPLVVGFTPRFATGRDSIAIMAHFARISERLARLPNPEAGRNVARPRRN